MDIFCKIIAGELPANIVYQDENIISIMDANPYSPGHILIIPKRHYTTILDIDDEINAKILATAKMLIKKIETSYPNVVSVKIGINYGDEQKVKHYHMHLIPLYEDGKIPTLSQEEFCELIKK